MNLSDSKHVALRFNDSINARDIDGLARLMADDHTFIDSAGEVISGRKDCLDAWRGFFDAFPDYQNIFKIVLVRDDLVTIRGYSTCSDTRLDGPAIWTARVKDRLVSEWRVYLDSPENRARLDITGADDGA